MPTPADEIPEPHLPPMQQTNSFSDDEGTLSNEFERPNEGSSNEKQEYLGGHTDQLQSREQEHRLNDDLAMLQAERVASNAAQNYDPNNLSNSMSVHRTRSRPEPVDQFDINTNPIHEKAASFNPPEHPTSRAAEVFKKIHDSSFLVRWFSYIVPLVLIILIPLLLGALLFKQATVGGVKLLWFCVWLEIVWLTLWGGRIVAKVLPYPVGVIASLLTNNNKKWRDMSRQLELPATLLFWAIASEVSFLPIMIHNHLDGSTATRPWEVAVNKVVISILVGFVLNFIEKIIIQLIAISFHLRTYADRIELNKFQIGSLTKLYGYSKEKIAAEDSEFEDHTPSGPGSGARTPGQLLTEAQKHTRGFIRRAGDVAGKVAGDFTGKAVTKSTHPRQVVLTLLADTTGSQVLARRLYRTFVREGADTIINDDLKNAFDNDEEAESAFAMFDKDLNGDISMQELEAVCVEIGRERKSITASLKDLDSVVSKLDAVLVFFVLVAWLLILISLISTSAAGVLTSAGSAVLALSWLFSATAQEFLQSVLFVLVKHPFDCGDRVYIYGTAGSQLKGDEYFVKEISLLYTEFKKMEGHIVQAPNSYLNTLFILNMRRSGGLAEAVPVTVKFGTSLEQIDELRRRLLEFVKAEKREYQANILTEVRDVVEVQSVNLNVIFFYKSNWQNELLRLQRRNKFICAMMVSMHEIGIEGPQQRIAGQNEENPFYYAAASKLPFEQVDNSDQGPGPQSGSLARVSPSFRQPGSPNVQRQGTISSRRRGESISAMSRRFDFNRDATDVMGEVYDNRSPARLPEKMRRPSASQSREPPRIDEEREEDERRIANLERGTSRASRFRGIHRASTETQSKLRSGSSIHRNRFFSRRGKKDSLDGADQDLMEQGMAEIPESGEPRVRIDPRSGTMGSQAMRMDTNTSYSGSHHDWQTGQPVTGAGALEDRGFEAPPRARTEAYEMSKMPRTGQ